MIFLMVWNNPTLIQEVDKVTLTPKTLFEMGLPQLFKIVITFVLYTV